MANVVIGPSTGTASDQAWKLARRGQTHPIESFFVQSMLVHEPG